MVNFMTTLPKKWGWPNGVKTVNEMVGQVDKLELIPLNHWRQKAWTILKSYKPEIGQVEPIAR